MVPEALTRSHDGAVHSVAAARSRPVDVRRAVLASGLVLATLAGFAVPLFHHAAYGKDWKYFDSLSLVVRSIVLHYHRAPLQDPWVLGGMDILANPQSRVFSPACLADVLVPAPFANLASFMGYALFGIWGMFRLLRSQGASDVAAATGATLFVNSTWFGLHFGEGHIPFETFQLMPWILYFGLRGDRAASLVAVPGVMALFLLDGGPYPFIYSIVLLVTCAALGLVDVRGVVRAFRGSWLPVALGIVATVLVACAKLVPLRALYAARKPELDLTVIPAHLLPMMFFDPRPSIATEVEGTKWRFQELGCYIGLLGPLVVARALLLPRFIRQNVRWFLLMIFFLWIATGWGDPYNPWWVFQRLPLINNAHVQSRFLLLFHLAWVVVLCRALTELMAKRKAWTLVAGLLLVEGLAAKNYALQTAYAAFPGPAYTTTLITSAGIRSTLADSSKPTHYFDGTHSAKDTYEPARIDTQVSAVGERDYRGELYVTRGSATLSMVAYTPGRIEVHCDAKVASTFDVNANWLTRWVVREGDASAHASAKNLIEVDVPPGSQTIVLAYSPPYLGPVLAAFFGGIALFVGALLWLRRRRLASPSSEAPSTAPGAPA